MEFQNLGKHCSDSICRQKDFLPYSCTFCKKTYCQQHFRPEAHECPHANDFAKKAIVCPFCLVTIKYQGSHNEYEALDIHQATECEPANRERILKEQQKVLCESGLKCKTKLTELNTIVCQKCKRQLCLKCRMPEDHVCTKLVRDKDDKQIQQIETKYQQIIVDQKVKQDKNVVGGQVNNSREYNPNSYQAQANRQADEERNRIAQIRQQQQQQQDEQRRIQQQQDEQRRIQQQQQQLEEQRRAQQLQQQQQERLANQQRQQQQQQTQLLSNIQPNRTQPSVQIASKPAPREICDQCGKSFADFMELWAHAEQIHQNNKNNNTQQSQKNEPKEVCEVCGKSFMGFEELFAHAESAHYVSSH